MHTNFIQMPPDGVGKKVLTNKTYIIPVNSVSNLKIGDKIQNSSGTVKLIIRQISFEEKILYTIYNSIENEGKQLNNGDSLFLENDLGTPVCFVSPNTYLQNPEFYYINLSSNVSFDNPYHGQRIDEEGQSYIRFAEGSQLIDGSGLTKISNETVLGNYSFSCSLQKLFSRFFNGGGEILETDGGKILRCSDVGFDNLLISNKYHLYNVGCSIKAEFLLKIGDQGKPGVVRRWGYGDPQEGYFFELDGTDFYVVRKSLIGNIEERVHQSNFNIDSLDGFGVSKDKLDLTKCNRFWIDMFRGTRVRMGIYSPKGGRIICHIFEISNSSTSPGVKNLSLPILFLQKHKETGISSSEMTIYEARVVSEGFPFYVGEIFEGGGEVKLVDNNTWVPLMAIRAKENSNFTIAVLQDISVSCIDFEQNELDGIIKFEIFKNPTSLDGDNGVWITKNGSNMEYQKFLTGFSGGEMLFEQLIKGTATIDGNRICNYLDEYLIETRNGNTNTYVLAAKTVFPGKLAYCYASITWREFKI